MLDGRIKNLLIDFGGVLIDLDRRRCLVESLLNDYHQEGFFQLHEKGLISDDDFRERIRQTAGHPIADEAIDEAWNSFLDGIPAYKLDFLPELRKRYKVCLLSNTNAIHWNYACTHDFTRGGRRVEDYFDHIYLSYRMKMIKPDAEIFQAVLDDTRWVPQETLFIDDAEANCRTAQSLGIRTYTPQAHEDWACTGDTASSSTRYGARRRSADCLRRSSLSPCIRARYCKATTVPSC